MWKVNMAALLVKLYQRQSQVNNTVLSAALQLKKRQVEKFSESSGTCSVSLYHITTITTIVSINSPGGSEA